MLTCRSALASILFASLFALASDMHPALASDKHAPTIDELIDLKVPSTPSISPDGRFVAFNVQQANWTENRYETQIWLVNTRTGELIQLTNSKGTNSDPAWSPDGRWLGFISDRDGKSQIYVTSPSGGEPRQVTAVESGVGQFGWSPNGSRIAFTTTDPDGEEIKRRRERYSDFEIVRHDYRMNHLWAVEIGTGKLQRLTQGNGYAVYSFSWSPDGRKLAFDALAAPTLRAEPTANVYVCDVESGLVRKLIDEPGPNRRPNWSPDGKSIVFETVMGRPNFFTQNIYLGIISAEGGAVENITADFDESASFVAWAPDGIYFAAVQKTAEHLFRVEPKTHKIERTSPQDLAAYRSFSFTKDFKRVAFIETDATNYPEVYVSGAKMLDPNKLTNYAAQLNDFKLAQREVISWKSSDGTIIEGALMKPADFDPAKKYPLLVVIHGGPGDTASRAVLEFDDPYPKEMWVAKGALVLEPNYRGSAGYGQKFHQLIVRNMGAGDYDDVISGVDFLIAKGWVDKDRVGAMGWSFGGFVSAWIATHSDRFKAVSVGAGPTDWVVFDAFTELQEMTRHYLAASPWSDPEIYRKNSPITNVRQAKTPTMIEHGEFDPIVPVAGAYELYQGLVDQGVPARFYLYKGLGHDIDTPKGNRTVMEHNLNWFNHYLWGEPDQEVQ